MFFQKFFLVTATSLLFFIQAAAQRIKSDTAKVTRTTTLVTRSNKFVNTGLIIFQKINTHYDSLEKNIEMQYVKLIQEARNNKSALEDKVKATDKEINQLKEQIKKMDIAMQKPMRVLPSSADSGKLARRYAVYKDSIDHYNKEIMERNEKKSALRSQIKAIDKTIKDLQTAREKEIAAIRKQKQKALAEAAKKN